MGHIRHKIATLAAASVLAAAVLAPAPAGAAAGVKGDHGDPEIAALRDALQAVVDAGATGVIALIDDSVDEGDGDRHGVTRLALGAARLDPWRAIRAGDQVRVGSITKTAMAVIALQLVGEGRLRLGDTVERWLPGVVPNGSRITIRMLLNHTSGIFNYTNDEAFIAELFADPYRIRTPQELIDVATSHPPVFPPGKGWSYSNTGYILVGLVLEQATGHPVQDLVRQRIARPLHLGDTYFATSGRFRGAYAHGYAPPSLTGAGYEDLSAWPPSWAWAAGALVSNAGDLRRFYQALLSGRLLPPWLLRQMTTTVDVEPGFGYGLGIYTSEYTCGTVWGHDGGIPGYVSFALNDRKGTRSAVLLLPTEPDEAIASAGLTALEVAVCAMFDQPLPPPSAERSLRPNLTPTLDPSWADALRRG